MNNLTQVAPSISIIDGKPVTTSQNIANIFKKRHKTVLRAISKLECSAEFTEHNFVPSEYVDSTGRKLPMFQITRDGFAFLCMGFTGKEAAMWKESYIDLFNKMEAELLDHQPHKTTNLKTKKALPNGLTLDQCDSVKALVKARVEPLPKEKQGKAAIRCWSAIKSKFGCGYKEVPPEHFTEVLSLIARLPLEGEFIAKDDSGPKGGGEIDAQGLLFGNLPKSDVPLPDELKLEVEKKAFEMGHHAYELSKEHLARVIRYRNYTKAHGYLKESALRTIQETTLDNALVHPHLFKLDMIRTCSTHLTAICSELNQDIERALMNEKKVLTAH